MNVLPGIEQTAPFYRAVVQSAKSAQLHDVQALNIPKRGLLTPANVSNNTQCVGVSTNSPNWRIVLSSGTYPVGNVPALFGLAHKAYWLETSMPYVPNAPENQGVSPQSSCYAKPHDHPLKSQLMH